jgi:hypothetical protein
MAGRLTRPLPLLLLIVSLAGIVPFSQGLRLVDTVGMLVCGAIAGASLAALALRLRSGQASKRKAP